MVNVSGKTITLTRGDTLDTTISIKTSDGQTFVPSQRDEIRFCCKSSYRDKSPIIKKIIPNNTLQLRLESNETKKLTARREPYVFDIQITMADGTVDTFISEGHLFVREEVD